MRWLRGMAAATAALAAVMGSMVVTTSSAVAYPEGCTDKPDLADGEHLQPGRALCNGNYLLRMQENGDLVLREISTGRACWHSNTFSQNSVATFKRGVLDPPWPPAAEGANPKLRIGRQVIEGANTGLHAGLNANLNEKGELWIGYLKKASC